jgi:hypothetical protein
MQKPKLTGGFNSAINAMNPIQIVKAHCDCYEPNNSCLGITANDRLQPTRFLKEGTPCLLASTPIKRCQHFESSILPMEKREEWARDSKQSARLAQEFREGAHQYRIKTGFMAEYVRLCPQCRSSKIGKGRKICDNCKTKNKRTSQSNADFKRHKAAQHSNSSLISDVDNQ